MTGFSAAFILMFVVMPLWVLAGLVDYFCHRATSIETTSGPFESALHLLQLSLVGFPIVLALFLHINAALIAVMIACILLHHGAAYIDVRYANSTRLVTPFEQMVHSFLELLPLTALLFICVLYWNQLIALFGVGYARADFELRLKSHPLPPGYVASLLGAAILLNWVPFAEEMLRTLRMKNRRASHPITANAARD
jgi:hypothetical protein